MIPGAPPPSLIRLALRVLSICPNSASCERLFSTFGLILTKLRTRLSTQNLVNLAEFKMHIRDENMRSETKKNLRQRMFGIIKESGGTSATEPDPRDAAVPINIQTNPAPTQSSIFAPEPTETPATSTTTARSLRTLTTRLIDMLDNDIDIDLFVDPPQSQLAARKWPISRLFNFEAGKYWVSAAQRSATGSLDQEMEYYDLLDMDAAGEPDLDYDVDDCVDSIFSA